MQDMWLRFPHILELINKLLDDKSLIKCKEASRIMSSIIEKQKSGKYLTIRMIQCNIKNHEEFAKDWRIIFQKLPMERLKEFGTLVKYFYKSVPSRFEANWTPMHIAAECGHLEFCRFIAKVSPIKRYNFSPLLFSAQAGHLEVSKFIYEEIEDKNHGTNPHQLSAQHLAAKNGHLEIYKFLHEKSNDINPSMQEFITPLHLSSQHGHYNVTKYICDNTVFVGPIRSDQMSPLHLAVHRGHIKIAKLLIERNANYNLELVLKLSLYIPLFLSCYFLIYAPIKKVVILISLFVFIVPIWMILHDFSFSSPILDY